MKVSVSSLDNLNTALNPFKGGLRIIIFEPNVERVPELSVKRTCPHSKLNRRLLPVISTNEPSGFLIL